jgi:flagellar P-ring protein FlgI
VVLLRSILRPIVSAPSPAVVLILGGALLALLGPGPAAAVRIRDLAHFQGVRENQLVGYGIVVGLDGTGDKRTTGFTLRTMSNLLESVGVTMRPEEIAVKNVAAVMVTATLPPFAREGTRLDVTVASIGDAASLRGGLLVQTPLEAADGKIFAVAQGPLLVGGYQADSPSGTRVTQNIVTVGRIPGGAIIEREVGYVLPAGGDIRLVLERPDFTTANRVAQGINRVLAGKARALDAGTVQIALGEAPDSPVELMAQIGEMDVEPGTPARVVINERTGTIVAGGEVRLLPVAISHGSLSIRINTQSQVFQAPPFSPQGTQTTVVPQSQIKVSDQKGAFFSSEGASTLEELAKALNTLGVTPRDVIAIFQALKEAGALQAELEVL